MPSIEFGGQVLGRDSVEFPIKVKAEFGAIITGGGVMTNFPIKAKLGFGGTVEGFRYFHLGVRMKTQYHVEVCDPQGRVKWAEDFCNLVTTEGLSKIIDATFKTGLASPAWLIGLITGPGDDIALSVDDTLAEHPGWIENTDYEEEVRQAFTPGDVGDGAVDNTLSRAAFTISKKGKIAGAFMTDGVILYGPGKFSQGDREVETGDTLRVTGTLSAED